MRWENIIYIYIYFFCYLWNWLSDIKKYAKLYDVSDVIWVKKQRHSSRKPFFLLLPFLYIFHIIYFLCVVWWQNDETKKYWGNSRNSIMNLTTTKNLIPSQFSLPFTTCAIFLLMFSLIRNDILYLQHSISIWNQQCRRTLRSTEVYFRFFVFMLLDIRFWCE